MPSPPRTRSPSTSRVSEWRGEAEAPPRPRHTHGGPDEGATGRPSPAAKRPRSGSPPSDPTRRRGRCYSVSHGVYDRMLHEVPEGAPPPDRRRVFALVADWLAARYTRSTGTARPEFLTAPSDDGVVVYARVPPDRRAYVADAALPDYVWLRLWPECYPGRSAPPAVGAASR